MMSKADDGSGDERRASFPEAMLTIAWAFFGVRGSAGHERDLTRLRPVQVIAAGLFGALLLVLGLLAVIAVLT